jgi:mono/diheme cytochrome c family protein
VRAGGGIPVCAWDGSPEETWNEGSWDRFIYPVGVGGSGSSRSKRIRPFYRKRGDDAYQASCSGCHGSNLRATDPEAVDLTGPGFQAKWNGKTLGERFETIRDTMPLGNGNSLGDKTYMDILAFILQFNEFPPGNQELVPETAKQIVFVRKP